MDPPLSLFVLIIGVALITFFVKQRKMKKSQLPEVDERVIQLFQVFALRIITVSAIIGVVILAIYTMMGHESVPIDYIWLYLLITML